MTMSFARAPAGDRCHVLPADGDLGIDSDPVALLRRAAEPIAPGGTVLAPGRRSHRCREGVSTPARPVGPDPRGTAEGRENQTTPGARPQAEGWLPQDDGRIGDAARQPDSPLSTTSTDRPSTVRVTRSPGAFSRIAAIRSLPLVTNRSPTCVTV